MTDTTASNKNEMEKFTGCAIVGCTNDTGIQAVNLPGVGWLRMCTDHIAALLEASPIAKRDINIQE